MTATAPSAPPPSPRIALGRPVAALVGLLAVVAALGAGQLVAGVVSPVSAPFLAVGDAVIRLAPQPVVEFAKDAFGTADKPVLLSGMAVVLAGIAAVAGLVSRRRPEPGTAVITALGLAGCAAVIFAPAFTAVDLLAPVVALGVGVAVFRVLHRLAARALPDHRPAGPDPAGGGGMSRRGMLVGSSVAVGALSLGGAAGGLALGNRVRDSRRAAADLLGRAAVVERAPAVPPGADFADLGTPSMITSNADFYRIDTALRIPTGSAADWSLRIHGMTERELTLTYPELLARPLVERTITLACVSNPVGGDLISTATFTGVELRDVLLQAGVRPGAEQLLSTSSDGWTAGTPVQVVLEPDRGALLAVGMNGEPLPPEHGFPVRMVVPGLYGYVSATKWLTDIEVTTFDAAHAYWVDRGWAERAPIKTQSRIDRPRGFATVPTGRFTVAGIAWAQHTGIAAVQVRVDGGPWQQAELATEVNRDTWRMWKLDVDVAPGSHTVQSRAVDRSGATQVETRADPVPDGATGWPAVVFTAG
ncbi:MAG TPA: molybdopterin-dependent oxidoreductase [Pseudonocardia sp.]|nr:molybdopterin-dependent oxidoreductase [Pseudonocardia sp.]